jgi:hypothetical protein
VNERRVSLRGGTRDALQGTHRSVADGIRIRWQV